MKDDEQTHQYTSRRNDSLEPRVAKLEVGLDRLTEDVKDLANVVRVQGQTVEQEIQKLVVAVTQASGPRKTDWSTIFAGVALIMAIGSAVFWPLNQTSQDNKAHIEATEKVLVSHMNLENHPVAAALHSQLEKRVSLLEDELAQRRNQDKDELLQWRQKAMGLKPQK